MCIRDRVDREVKIALEQTVHIALENEDGSLLNEQHLGLSEPYYLANEDNDAGHILSEEDDGTQTSERYYIVNQSHEPDVLYNMELTDHVVQEDKTQDDTQYSGDKLVQENSTGSGDITDVRMIASGSGYTTLPTATITGDRFISLEDATSSESAPYSRILFEDGGRVLSDIAYDATDATVIPFSADIGRATSLNIIEHGINYTSAPTL